MHNIYVMLEKKKNLFLIQMSTFQHLYFFFDLPKIYYICSFSLFICKKASTMKYVGFSAQKTPATSSLSNFSIYVATVLFQVYPPVCYRNNKKLVVYSNIAMCIWKYEIQQCTVFSLVVFFYSEKCLNTTDVSLKVFSASFLYVLPRVSNVCFRL